MESIFIIEVVIPVPLYQTFSYKADVTIQAGTRVLVPFGHRILIGIVLESKEFDSSKTKEPIIALEVLKEVIEIDKISLLEASQLLLLKFIASYYLSPIGEALKLFIPKTKYLEQEQNTFYTYTENKVKTSSKASKKAISLTLPSLTVHQQRALTEISRSFINKSITLLRGITGSGKTEIYIHLIDYYISRGESVLFMLPEIALSSQMESRIVRYFGDKVLIYHSKVTSLKREKIYNKLQTDTSPKIILGARSSLFLPIHNLAFIIIDEEHDSSYKQDDLVVKYNARDLAIFLTSKSKTKVLLGSATPSIESYHNALTKKYSLVELLQRYSTEGLPEIKVINPSLEIRKKDDPFPIITKYLSSQIERVLTEGLQVLIFQNKRGYASSSICNGCGDVIHCSNCTTALKYHKEKGHLRCHYCDATYTLSFPCKKCSNTEKTFMGYGTERLEEILSTMPLAKVTRLDADTASSIKRVYEIIDSIKQEKNNILVGTQMIAKGLDFDKVALVGIIGVDVMLLFEDFRASERAFQLITQVAGRAGRSKDKGLVILQSAEKSNITIKAAIENDYLSFFRHEISLRERFSYPPFCRIANIEMKGSDLGVLFKGVITTREVLNSIEGLTVFGPAIPFVGRIAGRHIYLIMVKFNSNYSLKRVKELLLVELISLNKKFKKEGVIVSLDVDPY